MWTFPTPPGPATGRRRLHHDDNPSPTTSTSTTPTTSTSTTTTTTTPSSTSTTTAPGGHRRVTGHHRLRSRRWSRARPPHRRGLAANLAGIRGCSSAGRALRSQCRGRRFESVHLHPESPGQRGIKRGCPVATVIPCAIRARSKRQVVRKTPLPRTQRLECRASGPMRWALSARQVDLETVITSCTPTVVRDRARIGIAVDLGRLDEYSRVVIGADFEAGRLI